MDFKKISYIRIKNRLWYKFVLETRNTWFYKYLYLSYWYSMISNKTHEKSNSKNYFSIYPNKGAGIGHQMANWISGYWWAMKFDLNYAYIPFPNQSWDSFLGFGQNEIKVNDLLKQEYKTVLLPLFNEDNLKSIELTKNIINSYRNQKVIYIAEQDQWFKDQYKIMDILKQKFFNAPSRKNDVISYSDTFYNIAIHVRRGDIVVKNSNKNANLSMRWQNNSYFVTVLQKVIETIQTVKPIQIYLFSQGECSNFSEFEKFENIIFCLDMPPQESFLNMVFADLLITSKSSFSYKPALINNGIKICPVDFWHGYPQREDWILTDENGNFNTEQLKRLHP